MVKQIDIIKKKQQYLRFIDKCKTVVISSKDDNGDPFTSYAPYVQHDGKIYIYISIITDHYKFIEERSLISIMMLADEQDAPNLFARERVRFQCTAENIGNNGHEEIFAKFENNHGVPMMGVLRGLDLSLFELMPKEGRYVIGFGQAFDIDLSGEKFEHVIVDKKDK
ncbi:pyridoxamine 5'-phosphate oxidase family protein [Viridibacillus sp. YIM B01967]|uniref:Pyridoxamine 5'-phosphate oxidase family protein n=1 Tax=Viridibacillus soli TaxID=2798301 RepID=A0ABS1HBA4_9BACL|nr:pyridoxamine 5'-phosphate oxidase family protein [Viridibacillus soli]MBK3496690.1 pyridoxamine 5'-phosphate oxidase family protein [Viridibacillus soli]